MAPLIYFIFWSQHILNFCLFSKWEFSNFKVISLDLQWNWVFSPAIVLGDNKNWIDLDTEILLTQLYLSLITIIPSILKHSLQITFINKLFLFNKVFKRIEMIKNSSYISVDFKYLCLDRTSSRLVQLRSFSYMQSLYETMLKLV